jgi:hypothetical protein
MSQEKDIAVDSATKDQQQKSDYQSQKSQSKKPPSHASDVLQGK